MEQRCSLREGWELSHMSQARAETLDQLGNMEELYRALPILQIPDSLVGLSCLQPQSQSQSLFFEATPQDFPIKEGSQSHTSNKQNGQRTTKENRRLVQMS